jgi:putative MATE family efflux protein
MSTPAPATSRPKRDLTSGRLGRLIAQLALPSMVETALMSVSGLLQAYWLGQIGSTGLAAMAVGTTLRIVLISPMMGLSGGGMAIVARHIGAHEERQADHAVMQTMLLGTLFVIPLSILGQIAGPTFLRWMGVQDEVLREAIRFLRIIFAGLFFMEMLPSLNGVIRGAGHPEWTLRINIVATIVSAILLPILVLGWGPIPRMGVSGAALASVLSSAAGVLAQWITLLRGWAGVSLHREDVWLDRRMMGRILRISLPTAAQRFSPNLANALLVRLVTSFGSQVLAAYVLASRVTDFLQFPAMGISTASATMVGQNLGAKRPERAERAAFLSSYAAAASSFTLLFGLNLFAPRVLGWFTQDNVLIGPGTVILNYALLWCTASAWSQVMSSGLTGAGDALSPMTINIGSLWLILLPLAWTLSWGAHMGPAGIWLGLGVGYLVSAVAMTWIFRRGHWKTKNI